MGVRLGILIFLYVYNCDCSFIPDEQRLMDILFSNYEPASRPVYNASSTVLVKFGITLTQISDMVSLLTSTIPFAENHPKP